MFSIIKKYISERKKKKETKLYRSGFGWAMVRYYCEGLPIEEIESWVHLSKQFCNYNEFDEGIEHAIKIINDIKLIKQRYNFMKENIYDVNWSKKYIMTGSMRVSAKSNDDANSKVSKVLGDLVGSMQLTDEDSVESHIVEKNSI